MAALLSIGTVLVAPAPASAAPPSPASITVTPGRRMIKVEWASVSTAVVYKASVSQTEGCTANYPATTCTINPVAANVPLTVSVVACATGGTDCSAAKTASTKAGPPATPQAPAVTYTGATPDQRSVHLSWGENDAGAGIDTYRVTSTPALANETGTCTTPVRGTGCDLANMVANQPYTFKLTAIGVTNATGSTGSSAVGPASAVKYSGLPNVPDQPTVARVANDSVRVTWTRPNGGATPAGYTAKATTGGDNPPNCTATGADSTDCVVSGLDPATLYSFQVRSNGEGQYGGASNWSTESTSIRPGQPGQPDAPTVELGAAPGQVTVSWTAPEGGGDVLSYRVNGLSDDDNTPPSCTATAPATRCDISDMSDGVAYTFTVTAIGAGGVETTSAPSDPIVSQLPVKPATPVATLGHEPGTVNLTWDPPTTGGPVILYTVTADPDPDGAAAGTKSADCGYNPAEPSCTITDLDPTASYTFTVTAVGDLGLSPASNASDPVIPNQPGLPTLPQVALDTATSATVTWAAPAPGTGGAVDHYEVTATPSNGDDPLPVCPEVTGPLSCAATDLQDTLSYTFTISAVNDAGHVEATAVATEVPGAPTNVRWTLGNNPGEATVLWDAPSGVVPSAYEVIDTTGGVSDILCAASADPTCVTTELDPTRSYTFTVRASNILGGATSAPSSALTADAPGRPVNPAVQVTGVGEVKVTWTAPDGGGPIDHYTVTGSPSGDCPSVAADGPLECVVTGLSDVTQYSFTVSAVNSIDEAAADPTVPVLPAATGAPTLVHVDLVPDTPGALKVSWTAPEGAAVTNYSVTPTAGDAGAVPATCDSLPGTTTTCTYTNLRTDTTYSFVVRAANDVGGAPADATDPVVANKPGSPTAVMVELGGTPGLVTVSWSAASASPSNGAVDRYVVTATADDATVVDGCEDVAPGATKECVFDDLNPAKKYTFTVAAENVAGSSAAATATATVPDRPGKPGNVRVDLGMPGTATVTWDKPSGGETASYTVTADDLDGDVVPDPCTVAGTDPRTCTFEDMEPTHRYSFTVSATNLSGTNTSDATAPVEPNKPDMPGAPKGEVTGASTVKLTWTAPPEGEGGPVATYTVIAYATDAPDVPIGSGPCTEVGQLTCTFDELDETKTYQFTVVANGPGGGRSDESARSAEITTAPPAPPAAPTVELAGAHAVRVTWAEPEPGNGGPIEAWSVTSDPAVEPSGDCVMTDKTGCVFANLISGVQYRFTLTAHGTADRAVTGEASDPIVAGPPDTPARPTVKSNGTAGQVVVSWTAPDPGAGIAGYQVQSNPGMIGCVTAAADATSCVVSGLTPGQSYTFRVQALGANGSGASAFSPSSEAIVPQAPGRPTNVDVVGADRQIAVSWTAPELTERVAHYLATATPGGATCQTATNADTECVITGLQNTVAYTVTVTAVGTGGLGDAVSRPSSRVRPTAGSPGAPTGVTARAGDGNAVISWTAPAVPGDGIARYSVTATADTGSKTCLTANGTTLTCTVTGLDNLTRYTVTVVSIGRAASGNSRPSAPVDVTPNVAPGTPTGVTVTPGAKTLEVHWTAGSAGSGTTGFTATATPGGTATPLTCGTTDSATTTCTIANATPGTSYDVTVIATGVVPGVTSAASDRVTATAVTATAPAVPTAAPVSVGALTVTAVGSTVAATSVKLGASVTVTGTGYAAYTGVAIGLYPGAVPLATALTDATGKFSVPVRVTGVTAGTKATLAAGGLLPTAVKFKTAAITVLAAS